MTRTIDLLKLWVLKTLGKNGHFAREVYYAARYLLLYRGSRYFCPCCSARLRSFVPMTTQSGNIIPDMICPRCDSHPRHRLLWLHFQKEWRAWSAGSWQMLHLAPEFCFMRHFSTWPSGRYITADLDSPVVDCRADVTHLPFRTNSFDLVLCNHVLEHVNDDAAAMQEVHRVLKPAGLTVMQVPIDWDLKVTRENPLITLPVERERHFGQHDHVRQYGCDYPVRLQSAGFTVEVREVIGALDPDDIIRYGLDRSERLLVCTKKMASASDPERA